MKKYVILLFYIFLNTFGLGQNLAPNPSFENYHSIYTPLCDTACWDTVWYPPTNGTPDYFNEIMDCWSNDVPWNSFGYQYAKLGSAYWGISLKLITNNPN